jgi:hypothetical protein
MVSYIEGVEEGGGKVGWIYSPIADVGPLCTIASNLQHEAVLAGLGKQYRRRPVPLEGIIVSRGCCT